MLVLKDLGTMLLVGDGVIGAVSPDRHLQRWTGGRGRWPRPVSPFRSGGCSGPPHCWRQEPASTWPCACGRRAREKRSAGGVDAPPPPPAEI